MQMNVFFFNHLNKENGTEDSVSKFNMFEVGVSALCEPANCIDNNCSLRST